MKSSWRSLVVLALACSILLAIPSFAAGVPANPWTATRKAMSALPPDPPDPPDPGCFTYHNDTRYCNVVKIKNGVCVHNRWGQIHNGQTGAECSNCFDTVNNSQDFLVSQYTTPLEEGCYPYNDCQTGTVYTCAN
jgi:hypothetical protein